nr:DUF3578 domain-containing protein [Paenibacillus azoreducens]
MHTLGTLLRQTIPELIRSLSIIDPNYKIRGSVGQGNWVNIPWIAVMDRQLPIRRSMVIILFICFPRTWSLSI